MRCSSSLFANYDTDFRYQTNGTATTDRVASYGEQRSIQAAAERRRAQLQDAVWCISFWRCAFVVPSPQGRVSEGEEGEKKKRKKRKGQTKSRLIWRCDIEKEMCSRIETVWLHQAKSDVAQTFA